MTKEKVIICFVKIAIILAFLFGIILLGSSLAEKEILRIVMGIVLVSISLGFLFRGLKGIPEEERWVVEVFGKFYAVLGPGLHWIPPFFMRVRAAVPIWELSIKLFPEKSWLDFKKGGMAQLVNPILWGRAIGAKDKNEDKIRESVYKLIYKIENWEKAAKAEIELRFQSILNHLTVDEALKRIDEEKNWWEVVIRQFPDIIDKFKEYGFEGTEITLTDFEWSKDVVDLRQQVYEQERKIQIAELSVKAAELEATVKALSIGGVIARIRDSLVKDLKCSDEEAKRLAPQVFKFVKAADAGSLFLTRLGEGDDGLGPLIAEIVATVSAVQKRAGK